MEIRPPAFIVTETKYRDDGEFSASELPTTKGTKNYPGATQMSDKWIGPRLEDGDETVAKAIMDPEEGGYERWLMVVDNNGKVTSITKLDENAEAIGKIELKDGKVVFDPKGRPKTTPVTP